MKNVKFGILGFAVLAVIAVFLPFVSIQGMSLSLWKAGKLAAAVGESGAKVYLILGLAVALAALMGFAVKTRLSRPLAGGALALSLFISILSLAEMPEGGLMKVGGIGAHILVFGGFIAFIASIVALVKPERAAA